jgi:hypothetical protein
LVEQFLKILDEKRISWKTASLRAGYGNALINNWFTKKYSPTLQTFIDLLESVGYELRIHQKSPFPEELGERLLFEANLRLEESKSEISRLTNEINSLRSKIKRLDQLHR